MRLPIALVAVLFVAAPAFADTQFAPIPAEQTQGKPTGLELRITRYNGATNGVLEVEVRNPSRQAVEFSAKGLYFVPDGDPDHAPQRVGAVGPFQVKTASGWQREQHMALTPGSTTAMKLDVYCIDSHRSSPSSGTSFHVAKDRVPKPIREAIDFDADNAAKPMGGVAAPAAKSAVQSQVWKNRDKNWVPLDGEGRQEAAKK
jgi:hypothetical protein